MKKNGKWLGLVLMMVVVMATACSSPAVETGDEDLSLTGQTLFIYCGAGMTKPVSDLVAVFKDQTGCDIEVNFANASQSQSQIKTSQEGDLFIAGSLEELKPVSDFVSQSKELVKHIPVLAVKKGNPLGITGLNDLTKEGVEVVLGDGQATPVGKLADKALTDLGILDQIDVIARSSTAPEIFTALSVDECDAIIVWKENVTGETTEIVQTTDLDPYIKSIPAASLTFSANPQAREAFLSFLATDQAIDIWQSYGYEVLD